MYKRSHPLGRHKIHDVWDSAVHEVVRALDDQGRVYTLRLRDGTGPEKNVHRSELRVIPDGVAANLPPLTERPSAVLDSPGRLAIRSPVSEEDSDSDSMVIVELPTPPRNAVTPVVSPQATVTTTVASPRRLVQRVNLDHPGPNSTPVVRRSSRSTAGKHPNPVRLPRSMTQASGRDTPAV